MVSSKSLLKSVSLAFTAVLLVGTSACTYSRSVNKNFALTPEGEVTDGSDTIVDAGNNTVADNDADSDETITPSENPVAGNDTPSDVPAEAPAETPPSEETPPVVTPPAGNDICHRIAYASSVDGFEDRVFVDTDCSDIQTQNAEIAILVAQETSFKHARPTFSPDGQSLTTSLLLWRGTNEASIGSFQSVWNVEGLVPELKVTLNGDSNGDGVTDVVRFLSTQNPVDTLGVLTINAPMADCGNGIKEGFEVCDDGNQIPTDGCNNNCLPSGTLAATPHVPAFAKSLVYTKKVSSASQIFTVKTILENEPSLEDAVFTHENSVIFSARLNGASDLNLYAFDLENGSALPVAISGLDQTGVQEKQPSLSPDGRHIVYSRDFEIWTCELVIAKTLPVSIKSYACVNPVKVSGGFFASVKNTSPCYSHDGENIFFISNAFHGANAEQHDREVWRVMTDGSSPVNITDNDLSENTLSCSPAAGPTGVLK